MDKEPSSAEVQAREIVAQFEAALDRQFDAAEARSWSRAPKEIREAYGDPSLSDPPSRAAMEAWTTWLELRTNSRERCRENLEKGRAAARDDPERAEVYWSRAKATAERALAELGDPSDGPEAAGAQDEDVTDDVVSNFLRLLETYRGRRVVDASVLPAPTAGLRGSLERRYERGPDPALAEALIALPVFVPPEDAVAAERYLERRSGQRGPIGTDVWNRGHTVVQRIAGEQRVAMRKTLGAAPGSSGVASPIPVLDGATASRTAAAGPPAADQAAGDVGDIFAGCFLSLAGSLVGTIIGTVGVVVRTLPAVEVGELVARLVSGFVAGVVVGLIASFVAAPIAMGLSRRHAENLWVGAVAIAAAMGAALAAWNLFPI
jgi:hypothetical protein